MRCDKCKAWMMLGPHTDTATCQGCGHVHNLQPPPPIGREATPTSGPQPSQTEEFLELTEEGSMIAEAAKLHIDAGITLEEFWDRL